MNPSPFTPDPRELHGAVDLSSAGRAERSSALDQERGRVFKRRMRSAFKGIAGRRRN